MDLEVVRVDRTTVEMPYREVHARNMHRQWPSWKYFELCELELACGAVGHGETMLFYGWGKTEDEDVARARGENAAALMWDDSLGAGLQMALFDAVGRALGVPVHDLLGEQVTDSVPLSWWCLDMPTEDWVSECEAAVAAGYDAIKLKGRPWFDIREQLAAIADATPPSFEVDIDFNRTMLDAERALPVLEDLAAHPQVRSFEEPIHREDDAGNRRLREALDVDIAHHYSYEAPIESLAAGVCDGCILTGGATEMRNHGAVLADAGMPLWLQLVGTGITATFCAHLGAVLTAADWPAVNCHQLYEPPLLAEPFPVEDGATPVPDGPGLGREVDMDLVKELRTDIPAEKPAPTPLVETDWPDGPTVYTTSGKQLISLARDDAIPYFERGVETRVLPDDGSDRYADLRERAREAPVSED